MQIYEANAKTHAKAMRSTKAEGWRKAMLEEIIALQNNGVWNVIKRLAGANMLHSKWVFKTKTDANGAVESLKARLVACGNEQVFGIDYVLTFAAVMDLSTVKVILGLVATWVVPAKHGDIPSAYVKADKEKDLEILLHVPGGMDV
ncbi:FOG: Transposon-encoded proteins with TYA, reverse transcriptase, integrase domains in various combinations [Plasmopara halstedii]|uniref:FOG: Transposon-encoded proteins with TYA, reverse transcriptase, integrase domains in various combinations n=1 Tax=Plasmopara halstedii TaxID=4781 RepID=A0A0P1B3E6_PLAHL|nr:FOG: Transposon-encoded proteins with TYA, reverse transcriptase, integrase domains in various combinations [Plasmopara halstedii]CEG48397.1 FOG: Transposon-encoded proteins with TYA, reverse transcriptase, integrase domains in various combinations [Plasmopara halstedii]|eukprot:XP_024584766.1 FOG: Transposon-encoded proteins with TYA, reverse transcriptase, integrase domains in various combinations [Plasmopara halstedii]